MMRAITLVLALLFAAPALAQQATQNYVANPFWKGPQDTSQTQNWLNLLASSLNQGLPPGLTSAQFGTFGGYFPYGGNYAGEQTFASGTAPLSNNLLRSTGISPYGSTLNITNLFPHGVLNSASTAVLTTNPWANDLTSDPGYGCVLGFPQVSDIALGNETGAVTLCPTANGAAPFLHTAGTFTSTEFIPAVPTTLPAGFPTTAVWIYSNDQPVPWEGLANATLNGNQVTAWTVIGGWYQQGTLSGGTGQAGTPSGTAAYIGVQDKQWTSNFIGNSAPLSVTGNVQNGNATIPVSGASAQYLAPRQWLEDAGSANALASHTRIVSVANDYSSITVAPAPVGNASGEPLSFSVQPTNRFVLMEGDVNNGTHEAYDNFTYQFTGNTTSGSRHITNLSTTAPGGNSLYPHLACESISGAWAGAIDIDAIQYGSSSMDMDANATGTATGTTIRCQARYDDAGGGLDIYGQYSSNDFVARGYPTYGFRGMGATDTLFYAGGGPDGARISGSSPYAPIAPIYAFRSDHSWYDADEDFAITDDLKGQVLGSWDGLNGILIDLNTHTLPGSTLPNQTLLHLGAADSNVTSATLDAFGSTSEVIFRSAHGTAASPTALTTSDSVGGLNFGGYDGTNWAIGGAQIVAVPSATWSTSSHPLDLYFQTTPIGSTTPVTQMTIANSGLVTLPKGALFSTAGSNIGAAFTNPFFGGTWTANNQFTSAYTNMHTTQGQYTAVFGTLTTGSGGVGGTASEGALFLYSGNSNYLSNTTTGEHDTIYIATFGGINDQADSITSQTNKVYGGTEGGYGVESQSNWTDTSGNHLMTISGNVALLEGGGGVSGNTGFGMNVVNVGATQSVAASQIYPFSMFEGEVSDGNNDCGVGHCPYWQNVLVATNQRASPNNHTFFQVTAGLTEDGAIIMGSGTPTAIDGSTATTSGGTRLTLKNVGGSLDVLASDGATPTLRIQQGSAPTVNLQSTTTPITSGGLWRIAENSSLFFTMNTAAGGDYSTQVIPLTLATNGDVLPSTSAALSTSTTGNMLYTDAMAGTPTGTPANAAAGRAATAYDTTHSKLCIYNPVTPAWGCSPPYNYPEAYIAGSSGTVVTNTGIGTSEVNLASIAIPALGANDALRITTLWSTGGTTTDSKNILIRLSTTGCTSLSACTAGTPVYNVNMNTSSLVTASAIQMVRNAGTTNSQNVFTVDSPGGTGSASNPIGTATVQTNAGGFINIDCTTTTSSADSCSIEGYTVEVVPAH